MNAIIERILIFNKDGEKRELQLSSGLNVITGDSKTGKSALIEIVDYCLFSARSTVPKGVIENFAELYAIILKISEKYIVIARPSKKSEDWNKVYIKIETDITFLSDISIDYFYNIPLKSLKDGQFEVENHLGIAVLDTRTDDDLDKRTAGKTTIRSIVPLLFQHQNLVANKHTIFYRFDNYYKRKKTVDDFPILIGWENSDYFLLSRQLENKNKELKSNLKIIDSLKIKNDELSEQLKNLIDNYFKVIGLELDDNLTLPELKRLGKNLPEINPNAYSNLNLNQDIIINEKQRDELKEKLNEKLNLLTLLENNSDFSRDYISKLYFLENISDFQKNNTTSICPICKNQTHNLNREVELINESKNNLIAELSKIKNYKHDNSQQIEKLRDERDQLKRKINQISGSINSLKKQNEKIIDYESLREQAFTIKGATEANIDYLLKRNSQINKDDIINLKEEIHTLKEKLKVYDLKSKINVAETFLSERMTKICHQLNFEKELQPGTLKFDIEKFDLCYHFKDKEEIYLSDMGSGANWLACHISLFIALLHLNCLSCNSSIPSVLFIDQPSQVYFPKEYGIMDGNKINDDDDNIKQVKNIFDVLLEQIEIINRDCDFEPQIIVLEHADETEFSNYVKARWINGKALI